MNFFFTSNHRNFITNTKIDAARILREKIEMAVTAGTQAENDSTELSEE
jgi:hypothetical protein